jgi:hypothetical protein
MARQSVPVTLNPKQAMRLLAKVGRQMVNPNPDMAPVISGKARLVVVTYLKKVMNVVIYDRYNCVAAQRLQQAESQS